MPLHAFAKLFPKHISTDGKSLGLYLSNTNLTAYNGSTILQTGDLDTAIEWKPRGHHLPNQLHTQWYVAGTPGPTIPCLPSSSKFRIVQLNCAFQLAQRHMSPNPVRKHHHRTREGSASPDALLGNTVPITEKHRSKAQTATLTTSQLMRRPHQGLPLPFQRHWLVPQSLPHHLKRWCLTYHLGTKEVSSSHVTLLCDYLNEFINQGIIVPVTGLKDLVWSLLYSWKANCQLYICLEPRDFNLAIQQNHYRTPELEEIIKELARSTPFTKLHCTLL